MSSLAATQADNFYYPPGWTPDKGSVNTFQKSHPLGKRAKYIHEGILIVRFEMPFNVWCTSCNTHIGKGVRFNAKKKKTGMYFTTPIYEFRLTCATCKGDMVVQTDPKNQTYAMVSGIRQKVESFSHEQNEAERLNDAETTIQLGHDPLFRLEHAEEDKRIASSKASALERLIDLQGARSDNYSVNSTLRKSFRKEKHSRRKQQREAASRGIMVPLAEPTEEDRVAAKNVKYHNPGRKSIKERFRGLAQKKKLELKSASIFDHPSSRSSKRSKTTCTQASNERDRKRRAISQAQTLKIDFRSFQPPSAE